jgi:hypothetical protein
MSLDKSSSFHNIYLSLHKKGGVFPKKTCSPAFDNGRSKDIFYDVLSGAVFPGEKRTKVLPCIAMCF